MDNKEFMEMVSSFANTATELEFDSGIEKPFEEVESLKGKRNSCHPITVLSIDSNESDSLLLQRQINESGEDIRLVQCDNLGEAFEQLQQRPLEVVLLEYQLPEGPLEPEHITDIRGAARNKHLPIIVLTAYGDEEKAVNAFKFGASDYLSKCDASPERICSSIFNAIDKANLEQQVENIRTDIIESNRTLRRQNAQISCFYQTLCNDLKLPLIEAREFISLALDDSEGSVTPKQKNWLECATQCWDLLDRATDDLLAPIEIASGKLKAKFSTNEIEKIAVKCLPRYRSLAIKKGVELTYSCSAKDTELTCDSLRIEQLISNLLSNAIRMTPAGGNITLKLEADARGKMLSIAVRDAGDAIPEGKLLEAFEHGYSINSAKAHSPSDQLNKRLGLHLCKTIVEQHSGEIVVRSDPMEGNEFRAMLPLTTSRESA